MTYILDMVHHNPGEPPFESAFLAPSHLVDYGFNGQVFKHIHCIATFAAAGVDCFPEGSADREWLAGFTPGIEREIAAAKARGLMVFYHLDLFVLPKRLVERYREGICDPESGRLLLDRPKTLELHRVLFDELTARFPEVDGYIIRVGETYLFDTPYHTGNGPVPRVGPAWTPDYLYADTLGGREPSDPRWTPAQVDAYVGLIRFLREELCVKHGRQLFFRTWDIFPDKLHARLDHYLEVTDQIEPHPKLAFSIKHTALDFWRRVKVNECLTRGKHPQIIEVQCQREYEGKGAFPNYVMDGVINGFEENEKKIGLKDLINHPKILGVYSWSRGGGWYGPYIKNELWPDLNAYVLARFAGDPLRSEADVFHEYAVERMGLVDEDAARFRQLCLLSARAVLKGRHCEAFDLELREAVLPSACWMRDDRLGGHTQLSMVLEFLKENNLLDEALAEKAEAVRIWDEITALAQEIRWPAGPCGEFAKVSVEYGRLLFDIIHQGWRVLVSGERDDDPAWLSEAIASYGECWRKYRALESHPLCPSLYRGEYFSMPGSPATPGMDASVAHYQNRLAPHGSGLLKKASVTMLAMLAAMPGLFAAAGELSAGPAAVTGGNLYVVQGAEPRDHTYATLEQARNAIRAFKKSAPLPAGGVTVWIAGGDYWLPATFELTAEDSGEEGAPVIYRPVKDQTVRLKADTRVDSRSWKPLSPDATRRVHPKVDPAKLVELDLSTLDLKRDKRFAPGNRFSDQWHGIDLFANDRRQPISQWPNARENIGNQNDPGWTTMNGSRDIASFYFGAGGEPVDRDASNEVDGDGSHRSERWQKSLSSGHEVWLKGLWRTPWEPHTIKVAEINPHESWIRLSEQPPGGMGSKYSPAAGKTSPWRVGSGKENWFAINLLDEIDQPGEWALDVKDRKIYFYPPAAMDGLRISIADRDTPVIRLNGASRVHFLGLTLQGGMGHGIEVVDGNDNLVAGCTLSNIGNSGIRLERGFRNTVQSNDVFDGAGWGIELQNLGDRKRLIHSDTRIMNNHIHHVGRLAFREAIRMSSCIGVTVSNNLMHDLPKGAVRTDLMNDCLFESNEVHNIALRESDTGAYYNYGGWTTYGNVWRYNFIHHINRANGFYSDDGDSGDNYVKNIVHGSINALLFGGGHHNLALNNLFVENKVQSVDDRGISRGYRAETAYGKRLRDMKPDVEPWKSYGGTIAKRFGYKDRLWSDILDPAWKPEYPNGTVMADNVAVASGAFRAPANRGVQVRDNVIIPAVADAGFRDYGAMDLRTTNSVILGKFPELNEVFPQMGLVTDSYRSKVASRKKTGGLSNRGSEGDLADEDQMR